MPPDRAAELLGDAKLHAYLGPEPRFPGAVPKSVRTVESLGHFVIVGINPGHLGQDEPAAPLRNLRVKADGGPAGLVRPEWRVQGTEWDAAVEEIGVAELLAGSRN